VRNTISYLAPSAYPGAAASAVAAASAAAATASHAHQEHHPPREFVPDVPSAYHGSMMNGLPMAAHP